MYIGLIFLKLNVPAKLMIALHTFKSLIIVKRLKSQLYSDKYSFEYEGTVLHKFRRLGFEFHLLKPAFHTS